jgi:hypothetical protein
MIHEMLCTLLNITYMSNNKPMFVGALNDSRKALKWATDCFLKAHIASTVFSGQVGRRDLDHAYLGRPEDMTMERPA